MNEPETDPKHLSATEFMDFRHPAVQGFLAEAVGGATESRERAVRLFYAVRDRIRYDPYLFSVRRPALRASHAVEAGVAFCVPKALLFAACLRAVGIPARPGFADVRNHLSTEKLTRLMGTDVFAWHGYVSLLLDGRWVKATPAFNREMCERFGVLPLEFDGTADSLFHPYDASGQRHMEYVRQRGEYDDLPYDEMVADLVRRYPQFAAMGDRALADFVRG